MFTHPKQKSPSQSTKQSKNDKIQRRKALNRALARQQSRSSTSDQDAMNRAMADFHGDSLADLAYAHLSSKMGLTSEPLDTAFRAGLSMMQQMRPRDPLERLALSQALMAHARVAWLTMVLARATPPELSVISEATERAAGTFARMMRAIAEHRQPRNSSAAVSIAQANLGHQQIVQNVQTEKCQGKKNVDDQTRIDAKSAAIATKSLPADAKGIEVSASGYPKITALDEKHRSENRARKIQGREERVQARPAIDSRRRTAEADPSND